MAKKSSKSSGSTYTKPELREKLKEKVKESDKGGKKGQWSARKSQLLAQEYKAKGGGYEGEKGAPQKSIDQWTDEKWTTSDGKKARKGDKTDRYLPKDAWEKMTPAQKKATKTKKQSGSKAGEQNVSNTPKAKASRKKVSKKKVSKKATRKTAKKTTKKTTSKKTVSKKTAKKTPKKTGKKTTKKTARKSTSKKS